MHKLMRNFFLLIIAMPLLAMQPNNNQPPDEQKEELVNAVKSGENNVSLVEQLLDKEDPDSRSCTLALIIAVNQKKIPIAEILLKHGVLPQALHFRIALTNEYFEMADIFAEGLVKRNIPLTQILPDILNQPCCSVPLKKPTADWILTLAVRYDQPEIIEFLANRDLLHLGGELVNVLALATEQNKTEVAIALLRHKVPPKEEFLIQAVGHNNLRLAQALVDKGLPVTGAMLTQAIKAPKLNHRTFNGSSGG